MAARDCQIAKLKAEVRPYTFSVEPFERRNTHIMEPTKMLSDTTVAERPNEHSSFTVLSETERKKHRLKGWGWDVLDRHASEGWICLSSAQADVCKTVSGANPIHICR